jgi:hypothetical protein
LRCKKEEEPGIRTVEEEQFFFYIHKDKTMSQPVIDPVFAMIQSFPENSVVPVRLKDGKFTDPQTKPLVRGTILTEFGETTPFFSIRLHYRNATNDHVLDEGEDVVTFFILGGHWVQSSSDDGYASVNHPLPLDPLSFSLYHKLARDGYFSVLAGELCVSMRLWTGQPSN